MPASLVRRGALGWLLLAALSANAANYPQQPAVGEVAICVSDGGLFCMDPADPARQWSALIGEHTLEPVLAGDKALVGGAAGLHVFEATTGERRWQWRGNGLVFPPTVANGVVFASDEHGRLRAMDLGTGRVLWQRRFDGWSYPPAVIGDRLVTGGRDGVVRALDPADGATRWQQPLEQELVYRPVAAGGLAIVTTFDGAVTAFDREGERVWTARDPVPSFSPAVAGDLLVFGGWDGRLRARRLETGELVWTQDIGGGQLELPAGTEPGGTRVGVRSPGGELLLLDRESGDIRHRTPSRDGQIGAPFHHPGRGWATVVVRSGTIVPVALSDLETDAQ